MMATQPLSLYVHIPWCVKKCPYCDFNSHAVDNVIDENRYVDALMHDLDQECAQAGKRKIETVFFGGGTPSLFSPESFDRILSGIKQRIELDDNAEITMEANPGTVEQQKFSEFYSTGINRLSIGIQSFDNNCLEKLGRIHDSAQAESAISTALVAGFNNINTDLMFGLPEQTVDMAIADLSTALGYAITHVSHYQLTIEPNTFFYSQPPALPDMDTAWDMQNACHNLLAENGYQHYEVSAFAREEFECRHNINYWQFGDYIGIGAGAHGKMTDPVSKIIHRRWKRRQPADYMQQAEAGTALSGESRLEHKTVIGEFLMNALRLRQGVPLETFYNTTGLDKNDLMAACRPVDAELLLIDDKTIRTSATGYRFLNTVLEKIV